MAIKRRSVIAVAIVGKDDHDNYHSRDTIVVVTHSGTVATICDQVRMVAIRVSYLMVLSLHMQLMPMIGLAINKGRHSQQYYRRQQTIDSGPSINHKEFRIARKQG
ncbi:hypothetical protein GW17_00022188 [Ensete ventricosum]|nr:hypothetical protein GW17_00022188 [Ensete ventricosum]